MEYFKIEMEVNGEYKNSRWNGYGEQSAIAQCMLYEAQNGAREIKILEIKKINS